MKLKFFHLLPSDDLGGAENAAKTSLNINNKDFILNLYFIHKNSFKKNLLSKTKDIIFDYFDGLKFFLKENNIVLISSLWKSGILSILVKLILPETKIILFLHSPKNGHLLDNLITSWTLYLADEVWTDSYNTKNMRLKDCFVQKLNIDIKIISFILQRLDPVPAKNVNFNFIYWGRLAKVKNLLETIKFFNKFYLIDNSSRLTLIGHDCGMKKKLDIIINKLGLQNNVDILGFQKINQIVNKASNNSFFIQLSSSEGMAMSVVESMQLGIVPIVTNVGEIQNYCIDKENSIIFEGLEKTFEKVVKIKNNYKYYSYLRNNAINAWKEKILYKDDIYASCKLFYEKINFKK